MHLDMSDPKSVEKFAKEDIVAAIEEYKRGAVEGADELRAFHGIVCNAGVWIPEKSQQGVADEQLEFETGISLSSTAAGGSPSGSSKVGS